MNKKMGRPPLPKGQSKDVQIGVRFNGKDDKKIEKAITDSGVNQTKAEWIRDAARLVAADSVICAQYSVEELDDKTITFRIQSANGWIAKGAGKIMALQRGDGSMKIQIESRFENDAPNAFHRFLMPQAALPWLKKLPPSSAFDFQMDDLSLGK
jgi:hypothetical protein